MTQATLPPLPEGASTEHRIDRPVDTIDLSGMGDEARELLLREQDSAMAVVVPDELRKPHPWIRKSAKALRTFEKEGKWLLNKQACLDVQASRSALGRALWIADALPKVLEARGFKVEVTDPDPPPLNGYYSSQHASSRTGVHILGSFVEFGIAECMDAKKIDPTRFDWRRRTWRVTGQYERRFNGKLSHIRNARKQLPVEVDARSLDGKRIKAACAPRASYPSRSCGHAASTQVYAEKHHSICRS
ncbi:MAG: hypothetical protein KAY32_03375 [Candidatus Eisenbacteria sp.]|nr:hypothetical protein [Candidatus Eisenbacteria bacterium]